MSKFTKWGVGATALLATGSLLLGASAAQADPWDADLESYTQNRPLNGTGSDTTQDLNNGLAAVVRSGGQLVLGSWDATLPTGSGAQGTTIVTHSGGTTIPRPNGSGQGVAALKATVAGTTLTNARGTSTGGATADGRLDRTDLQFARSSSGPSSFAASGTYSYVPLAVDAVTYAKGASSAVPDGLTVADLTQIYQASAGQTVSLSVGSRVIGTASTSGAQIVPLLPQSGSGTRSFFLSKLGLTEASLGSAVAWTYTAGGVTTDVQEHDGAALAAVSNAIVPFSIAQWIAQSNAASLAANYGVSVLDRRHGAVLAPVTVGSTLVQPTTGTTPVLNTAFPLTRPVFTVVEHAAIASNSTLSATFIDDPATADVVEGAVYTAKRSATAQFVIEDFGFGSLINRDTDVNGVTIQGVTYKAGDAESIRTN
ncbi:hypothetical protein [Cellulomonas soli]|uniref:Uncharacterized protein n=1 Tax=Cellulomonas soli TaxID=931535 RepID=A0A512P9B1_9CELL|nr:hypothetical protein [Cellulomonas soli]NYI60286.1 hypothetical protein [Cellulomonas soli]GEP67797.1 hypothetical protein CSO01_05120 [Cellulomonas soli]